MNKNVLITGGAGFIASHVVDLLLRETDWRASSDLQLSSEWTTYRQSLRDITNGLTTVADIEAVTWPTKPE